MGCIRWPVLKLLRIVVDKCRRSYLWRMPKSPYQPCIPTRGAKVPDRPEWIHEIKHDGYRLIVQRDDTRVRLFTRNGHDWSERYPLITQSPLRVRQQQFVLDGEAVLLGGRWHLGLQRAALAEA